MMGAARVVLHSLGRVVTVAAALSLGAGSALAAFDPPVATDINADPDIVEVNLVAAETTWQFVDGIDTTVYTYNGTIPGPTIVAEVGDTVIVHFTNDLPEPTTIHWHGVDVPAAMDGSHISQLWVQPGESFDYEFVVDRGALFWYHPHVRTFDQVEKGLYGGLLVHDVAKEAELGLDQLEEHVIFFDDVLLDANFQIVPAFSFTDPLQNAAYQLNGREGNVLLLNGKEAAGQSLVVPNGEPQRWRVANAANVSIARLDINDLGVQLWELGLDQGFDEKPFKRLTVKPFTRPPQTLVPEPLHPTFSLINHMGEGILLFPGQRLDVAFTPLGSNGQVFTVHQNDWIRGRHTFVYDENGNIVPQNDPLDGMMPPVPYLDLVLQGPDPGNGEWQPPAQLTTIPTPGPAVGTLNATMGHSMPDPQGNVTLFVQADFSTGTMIPLPESLVDSFNAMDVAIGEIWDWKVLNLTHGDHPFHTHGFPFLWLEYEFQDDLNPNNSFKFKPIRKQLLDTIRAPARGGALGTTRTITTLRMVFDDSSRKGQAVAQGHRPTFAPDGSYTSGGWLFHCHILEHSARGMLSFFEVHDPNDPFTLLGKHLAGTNGRPSLTGTGDPGSTVTLHLVDALPSTEVILVGSVNAARQLVRGSEFVPDLHGRKWKAFTDSNGAASFVIGDLPPGKTLYFQVAFHDAGGTNGWAFSNALSVSNP